MPVGNLEQLESRPTCTSSPARGEALNAASIATLGAGLQAALNAVTSPSVQAAIDLATQCRTPR